MKCEESAKYAEDNMEKQIDLADKNKKLLTDESKMRYIKIRFLN